MITEDKAKRQPDSDLQKQRGYGFSFHLMDFSARDMRIALLKRNGIICVNRRHPNYKVVEKCFASLKETKRRETAL